MTGLHSRLTRLERAVGPRDTCPASGGHGDHAPLAFIHPDSVPGRRAWGPTPVHVFGCWEDAAPLLQNGRCHGCGRPIKVYGTDPDRL